MPAPLRIVLSEDSDRTLQELRVAPNVVQHIKNRAHMVRLNAQGWNVPAVAEIIEVSRADGATSVAPMGERRIREIVGCARTGRKTKME